MLNQLLLACHCLLNLKYSNFDQKQLCWLEGYAYPYSRVIWTLIRPYWNQTICTNQSAETDYAEYVKWPRSDKVSLQIIKNYIARHMRGFIAFIEKCEGLFETIEWQWGRRQGHWSIPDEPTFLQLSTMKYDRVGVREHRMKMVNLAPQPKNVHMIVSDVYVIKFVLNSLPSLLVHSRLRITRIRLF